MKYFWGGVALAILCLLFLGTSKKQPIDEERPETSYTHQTVYTYFSPTQEKSHHIDITVAGQAVRLGTGTYLTNAHVIKNNELTYEVEEKQVVNFYVHPEKDLALIKTLSAQSNIIPLSLSKLPEPYGLIDGKECPLTSQGTLLTTPCIFSPGMSGTPVFDSQQQLIGLVTAIDQENGYIVPVTQKDLSSFGIQFIK